MRLWRAQLLNKATAWTAGIVVAHLTLCASKFTGHYNGSATPGHVLSLGVLIGYLVLVRKMRAGERAEKAAAVTCALATPMQLVEPCTRCSSSGVTGPELATCPVCEGLGHL